MTSTFRCVPLRATLTPAACGKRFGAVRAAGNGQTPKGQMSLHSDACRGCAIGAAHELGEQPSRWPDGSPVVRITLAAHRADGAPMQPVTHEVLLERPLVFEPVSAVPAGDAQPMRDRRQEETVEESKQGVRTLTHDGRTMTFREWAEALTDLELTPQSIDRRIRLGWSPEEALTTRKGGLPPRLAGSRSLRASKGNATRKARAAPVTAPQAQDARERLRTAETIPAPPEGASEPLSGPHALRVIEQVGLVAELLLEAPRGPVVLIVVDDGSDIDLGPLLTGIGSDFEELGRGPRGVVYLLPVDRRDRAVIPEAVA